jgi:tetratricopeptide (TPR) repeat protein/TolB-like protein
MTVGKSPGCGSEVDGLLGLSEVQYNRRVLRRILIYLALALAVSSAAHADSSTVLVFPFENLSNDRTLDWIGEGISELIIGRLQPEPGVYICAREERITAYDKLGIPETALLSRATALKLGWEIGSDNIVTGSFSGTAGRFQIVALLVDMEAGSARQIKVEGKLEDLIPLTASLSWQLLKKIVPGTASPESDYTARPPTPRSAFENYVRGILNQDLQKRIEFLQTAVRLYPRYGSALFQLGRAYHLQREFRMSNEWLQKAPDTAPERRQVQFLIGLNYFYLGDYAAAISSFRQLPETYDVLLNVGAAFSQSGDHASAIAAWKRAAAVDALTSDAFFNMGYVSFVKGDLDSAGKNLSDSLKLRARDSEALFLLGRTYEKQGRAEESQKLIAQASRLSQRVERWLTQPLPKLVRFATTTTFRRHEDVWNDQRLARRARGLGAAGWLDVTQADIDAYLFGDALRELRDFMRIYPDSLEARSLLEEVDRRRRLR